MLSLFLAMIDSDDEKRRFTYICEKYNQKICHITFSILQNHADSEVAVNDTLYSIARSINSIPRDNDILEKSYIYKIAKNAALKLINEKNNKKLLFSDNYIDTVLDSSSPADEVIENEEVKRILDQIKSLPENYRDILMMRILYDMSYADIASAMKIKINAVRTRFSRGLSMLREMMEKEVET